MTFEELLDQAIAMLRRRGRVTYRVLKHHFQLDDDTLEVVKDDILYGQPRVVDANDTGFVWTGASPATAPGEHRLPEHRNQRCLSPTFTLCTAVLVGHQMIPLKFSHGIADEKSSIGDDNISTQPRPPQTLIRSLGISVELSTDCRPEV